MKTPKNARRSANPTPNAAASGGGDKLARTAQAKLACDPAGHYSRADLFELKVASETVFGRAHKLEN